MFCGVFEGVVVGFEAEGDFGLGGGIEREVQSDLLVVFLAIAALFGRFREHLDGGFEFVFDFLLDRVDDGGGSVEVVDVLRAVQGGRFGFFAGEFLGEFLEGRG